MIRQINKIEHMEDKMCKKKINKQKKKNIDIYAIRK